MIMTRTALTRFLGIPACALVVAGGRPTHFRTDAVAVRAEAILSQLKLSTDDCPTQCEYGMCAAHGNDYHINYTPTPPQTGSDAGEAHSCAVSTNGCGDHLCDPGDENLPMLESLLVALDGAALRELTTRHSVLSFNAERQAMQLVGCGGQVIVSVAVAPPVAETLQREERVH